MTEFLSNRTVQGWMVTLITALLGFVIYTADDRLTKIEDTIKSMSAARQTDRESIIIITGKIDAMKASLDLIAAATRDRYTGDHAERDFRIRDLVIEGLTDRVEKLEDSR